MAEIRQVAELGPELDFSSIAAVLQDVEDVRGKVSRLVKTGELIGVVRGIYVTAPEYRKRPVSLEILANMIYGPSYVSFEYVLERAGLIPEAVRGITSATPKRNKDYETALGHFSYRRLPLAIYSFGYRREELEDGSGYLIACPEKALLDWLYLSGSVRSSKALEGRFYDDLRLDPEALGELDRERLLAYAGRMPVRDLKTHLARVLEKSHA